MAENYGAYFTERGADAADSHWAVRRQLAAEVRRLNELLVTSAAPIETLQELSTTLSLHCDRLDQLPQKPGLMEHIDASMRPGSDEYRHSRNIAGNELSPISGLVNAISPPMNMWIAEGEIHGRIIMGWRYEGPPGCVHGGFIAAVFDEFLGAGQLLLERPGPTGNLKVRYSLPTPLHQELILKGWVDKVDGRKNILCAELSCEGTVRAKCEAMFIAVESEAFAKPRTEL